MATVGINDRRKRTALVIVKKYDKQPVLQMI